MLNNLYKKCLAMIIGAVIMVGSTGCSMNNHPHDFSGDAFTDRFNVRSQNAFYHMNDEGLTCRLDYDSMQSVPLCNKPNCRHITSDCILRKFIGNVPLIADNCAYYFVDEEIQFEQNDEGKMKLKLGSSLYCYDLKKGQETKIFSIPDVSVAKNCYGMLLHDHTIYFITNTLSRYYDESGQEIGYGGTGGYMHLFAFDLSEMKEKDLCSLYDVDKLSEYHPKAPFSGEVYMKGLYNDKIYFNVGFVTGEEDNYQFYVTYYDLSDGTYHGTPEDYENIDFAAVRYVSEDYLVICRDGEAAVYKKHAEQPIVLKDPGFNMDAFLSVFDDTLYYREKIFDLNTCTARTLERMRDKFVVAKYGDSYVISDGGMRQDFEKIPAEELLK